MIIIKHVFFSVHLVRTPGDDLSYRDGMDTRAASWSMSGANTPAGTGSLHLVAMAKAHWQ